MKPKVYLETTIVSYLTARPSRDLITAAHQHITQQWWDTQRTRFDLFVAPPFLQEAQAGDPEAAARRLAALHGMPPLTLSEEATRLAQALIAPGPLPPNAVVDALHIAIAAVNGMHYLLTWNCTHIANAAIRSDIEDVCRAHGYEPPVLCTPEELLEDLT
jgi:hypothetical protein